MSDPKRLHPIAAVVNALRQLKEMIIPFLIFVVFGSRGTDWDLFYFFGSIGVVVLVLVYGVLSWYRFTYRIEQGELRIEYGLIVRKKDRKVHSFHCRASGCITSSRNTTPI